MSRIYRHYHNPYDERIYEQESYMDADEEGAAAGTLEINIMYNNEIYETISVYPETTIGEIKDILFPEIRQRVRSNIRKRLEWVLPRLDPYARWGGPNPERLKPKIERILKNGIPDDQYNIFLTFNGVYLQDNERTVDDLALNDGDEFKIKIIFFTDFALTDEERETILTLNRAGF